MKVNRTEPYRSLKLHIIKNTNLYGHNQPSYITSLTESYFVTSKWSRK
jgi:hypothetical protein